MDCAVPALVSVIIPTLRRHDLVLRAIRSVLSQTYSAFEIVVIIDGADPRTVEALADVQDSRLRVLQNETSIGPGGARNRAAETAKGEWIEFLDDDDEWLPQKLERQLSGHSSTEAVLLSCKYEEKMPDATYAWTRKLYENGQPVDEYLFDRRSTFRGDTYIGTTSYLMPTWLFLSARFGDTRHNEDTTLLLRLTKQQGATIVMVPEVLVRLYREEQRESLGVSYEWRDMLAWVDSMGSLITPRAYSGFCLIYLGSAAARARDYRGWLHLLRLSFARGRPTARQLLPAVSFIVLPPAFRRVVRGMLDTQRLRHRAKARLPGG